jgi:TonB family protein
MKVAVQTGTPNADGGVSKEQILKVVQSHAAAIQFCYEKELQRFPHLAGKVVIDWKVNLDGRVDGAKLGSSSLGNPSAESCMVRQIKNWQFPKPNGVICNVSFPFFFKGQ